MLTLDSLQTQDTTIAVVGLGYVGLPLAVAFDKYFKVIGFDISENRVKELSRGIDRTGEVDNANVEKSSIRYTSDPSLLAEASVIIVAVPTPIDYLPNVLMKREALSKGYDVPICFDDMGFLAEGATENICMVDANGELVVTEFTNCLAGTTMRRAIELINPEMRVQYRKIKEDEIFNARELIIVGTSLDALSIVRYDDRPVHDVRPGPVAKRLRELLRKDLQENGTKF